jgi:hypothetical protein
VRPERVADHEELCRDNRPLHCAAPECGRQARRIANGERSLLFDLSNYTSTPERRQYVLGSLAGHDTRRRWNGPCEVHEDPALGMLVGQAPEGQRAQACGVFWSPAPHWDTSGRLPRQATFLKREADGSARFVVRCRNWIEDATRPSTTNCQLLAFFGEWPLLMWVPNNRSADWEATYERVVGFLARHLVVQN